MPASPARTAAFDILLRVEQREAYASELLHGARYRELSAPDHALCTELVMGVLRWQSRLDRAIAAVSTTPLERLDREVLIAIRLGAYQLGFLDRVPARAALYESVELVKSSRKQSAAPFVNAVLRRLLAEPSQLRPHKPSLETAVALAGFCAHPLWLVERWERAFGLDTAELICTHDQSVPVSALCLRDAAAEEELKQEEIVLAPGALLASARRLLSGDLTHTRAFRQGRVLVQDEASQLVAALLGRGSRVLDCCAAPGGKTAALAERNPQALIVATDIHPHRARRMRALLPAGQVQVLVADARRLPLDNQFDRILADVPCSGTGTLARHPEIKWRLQASDLAQLHALQAAILRSALQHLAPGGRLLYATCSLERAENSDVVEEVLSQGSLFHLLDCRRELDLLRQQGELVWHNPDSLLSGRYFRTLPGIHPCDGFFAALIER